MAGRACGVISHRLYDAAERFLLPRSPIGRHGRLPGGDKSAYRSRPLFNSRYSIEIQSAMSETDASSRLRLYLIRHGEIEPAALGKLIGSTDVALSERGMEQARSL